MNIKKTYIDFSFLGVRSFTELLIQSGTEYALLDLPDLSEFYSDDNFFLNEGQDTITIGYATRDGRTLYFIEFGIMIAQDYNVRSYIVFIYDHMPGLYDIQNTIIDIEPLINEYMDKTYNKDFMRNNSSANKESIN